MNDKELTWGITDSNSDAFVGIISLRGFEEATPSGSIEFIIDQDHREYLAEVVERAIRFSQDHFEFNQLSITFNDVSSQTAKELSGIGFVGDGEQRFTIQL